MLRIARKPEEHTMPADHTKREADINQKTSMFVSIIDSLNISAIFALFTNPILHAFLEAYGKFAMFPLAAFASIAKAGLAWRQAKLSGWKPRAVVDAVTETVVAIGITTAVAMGMTASILGLFGIAASFGAAVPIIFTAILGGVTIWNAGRACYYLGKSTSAQDPEKKQEYRNEAKKYAIGAVLGAVATVAVAAVMVFGKIALAGLGAAGGLIGAGYVAFKLFQSFRSNAKKKAEQPASEADESEPLERKRRSTLTNSASLTKSLARSQSTEKLLAETRTERPVTESTVAAPVVPVVNAGKRQQFFQPSAPGVVDTQTRPKAQTLRSSTGW